MKVLSLVGLPSVVFSVVMMTDKAIGARLFGPGLPGGGAMARAHWRGRTLVVSHEGAQDLSVEAGRLRISVTGFNASERQVAWETEAGTFALHLNEGAAERLGQLGPEDWARNVDHLRRASARLEQRFRWGWAALALILAAPLLLLVILIAHSDRLADWVVSRVPVAEEVRLSEWVLDRTRLDYNLQERGPVVNAVREIGERLVVGSPVHYRWLVASTPAVNAFAVPGGVVVVNEGLVLAATSAEELAGVLAHEVAHVELRHGTKAMVKNLGLRALLGVLIGDWSGGVVDEAGARLLEMKFSRDAEQAADREALIRLDKAGISPNGLLAFFERLSKDEAHPSAVLSTHPLAAERMADLRQQLGNLPPKSYPPLAVDWALVKAHLR